MTAVRPGSATPATEQLRFSAGASGLGATVTAREFFYTTRRVDEFLFASEKRMASSADADFNVTPGGTGMVNRATRADDIGLIIFGMNVRFHVSGTSDECNAASRLRKR